jgi:lipoprotein-anchoring transpeptidase ErfK/SrfK
MAAEVADGRWRSGRRWARQHRVGAGLGALVALVAVALVAVLVASSGRSTAGAGAARPARSAPPATAVGSAGDSTLVATLHADVTGSATPGGPPTSVVPGSWFGAPSALPVLAQEDGFLDVRLAQRPNGSTIWIPAADATLSVTPYRIVVDLATEHLVLYDAGSVVLDAPAGIGTAADPTPTGNFFVALVAAAPTPAYGPFVIVTSGHSSAITDWEQSGDAIVAIHGPLGADAAIGTTGAAVSHGCVRLHDADLAQLKVVPAGSPVTIIG